MNIEFRTNYNTIGDWFEVSVNGEIVCEGHDISIRDVVRLLDRIVDHEKVTVSTDHNCEFD